MLREECTKMNQQFQQKESKERKQDAASLYFHDEANNHRDKEEKKSRKRRSSSGVIKSVAIVIIAVVAIAGIGFMVVSKDVSDLEGEWVRQPDDTDFAGMIVEIKEEGGKYIGVIKYSPVDSFSVGEHKWSDMTKAGFNTFYEYDLLDDGVTRVHTKIKISLDGKTLTNNSTNQNAEYYGKNQVWKKK